MEINKKRASHISFVDHNSLLWWLSKYFNTLCYARPEIILFFLLSASEMIREAFSMVTELTQPQGGSYMVKT